MQRVPDRQANPADSQDAPEVAVRKDGHIALEGAKPRDQSIRPVGDAGRRFAVRTPVAKEIPVGPVFSDLYRALPLIIAVIPLRQVRFDFRDGTQSDQFTGAPRALSWTGK